MKELIINKCMSLIEKKTKYSKKEQEQIRYGLGSIYLTFTKIIFIFLVSIILNIFKEVLVFMIIFSIIRTFAFGLHATKSWICWISSTFLFILVPYMCKYIDIYTYIKEIICLLNVLLIFKNAPADTSKRPIVRKTRRLFFKYTSTSIGIIYSIIIAFVNNSFIENCLMCSLIIENVLISPITYKMFNLPYNNYIVFLKKHPNFLH